MSSGPPGPASPGIPFEPPKPRGTGSELTALLLAFLPGALIVIATFFLYQEAAERQAGALGAICESEAGRVEEELSHLLDARAAALERLAAKRAEGGDSWRAEAAGLSAGPSQLSAVLDVDSTRAVLGVVPESVRMLAALDPRDDVARATALKVAASSPGREAVTVATAQLATGEREVLVCAPIIRGERRLGWIVGVMRLHELLDAGLQRTLHAGFSAGVLEGPTLLYGASGEDAGRGGRYARDATVARGPLLWNVEVWPSDELTRQLESRGPVAVFIAGMALAFCASLCIYLWREQRATRPD